MTDTLSSNPYEPIFTAQKTLFRTGATRSRAWRLDQLGRMERMVAENEIDLQEAIKADFKTASQEYVFETQTAIGEVAFQRSQLDDWMKPVAAPVPNPLAATGHRAVIYRDPYGVALVIGPFNGPLTLLLRPTIAALAAGNTCILTLSNARISSNREVVSRKNAAMPRRAPVSSRSGRTVNSTEICRPSLFTAGTAKRAPSPYRLFAPFMTLL